MNIFINKRTVRMSIAGAVAGLLSVIAVAMALAAPVKPPFVAGLTTHSLLASTVPTAGPGKGDVNPYGTTVIPQTTGDLHRGDVLVSNFNSAANQQGTGSTIMEVSPSGKVSQFARIAPTQPGGVVGLTTALAVLPRGYVIVGNLPAAGGISAHATAGGLTVLNSRGKVVETITGAPINGPWDATAVDSGSNAVLFVTNVLNGTVAAAGGNVAGGTVVRITFHVPSSGVPQKTSERVIATGFREHTDPNALIVGPTGVGLGGNGVLYVADTARNRIAAIPNALTRTSTQGAGGTTVSSGRALAAPLGLVIAPNGDIVTANGGNGNLVETTPTGQQAATKTLVPNGAGDLFGLAVSPNRQGIYYVDDAGSGPDANSLDLAH